MKHLKSSFVDLHRIFEQSITVRNIAEPLASVERDYPADRAREFMDSQGFDVLGVSRDGVIDGHVLRGDLNAETVGDHAHDLDDGDLLDDSDSLLVAADALREREWIFVRFLGKPSGIVTRSDLQKAPMRLWLFGLVSLLEMQMLRCIRAVNKDDSWWLNLLSQGRVANANKVYKLRQAKNEEICLSDCLQIADKRTIFGKDERLFALTGCASKDEWKSLMSRIENLRNNLAHSNDLGTESWREIAPTVLEAERVLRALEVDGRAS